MKIDAQTITALTALVTAIGAILHSMQTRRQGKRQQAARPPAGRAR